MVNLPSKPNALPAWFGKVENTFWWVFLIWTFVGFFVMPFEIGPTWVRENIPYKSLHDFIIGFLRMSDAIWMILAAGVVYFHAMRQEGAATARRWAIIIMIGSAVAEWVGAETGFPFGSYKYTDNMGIRLFGVLPFTIPLAWLVIILAARQFLLLVLPKIQRLALAFGVGLIALLTDLNLEFVAWKVRAYWVWYPFERGEIPSWPPWQNYVSWFVLATLLALFTPPSKDPAKIVKGWRPPLVLLLMNLLFLVVQALRLW